MSNSLATASSRAASTRRAPGTRPGPGPAAPARPSLQVVQAPVVQRGHAVAVVLALIMLAAGLLTLLLINTGLAQGSFRLSSLQNTSDVLADRQQALVEDIESQAAPQNLSARARAMGMVPSESEAFIRLSDGKTFGVAVPAKAPARPTVTSGSGTSGSDASTKDKKTTDKRTTDKKKSTTGGTAGTSVKDKKAGATAGTATTRTSTKKTDTKAR